MVQLSICQKLITTITYHIQLQMKMAHLQLIQKNNVKFTINALGYKTIEKVIIFDPSIDTLHFSFEMEIEAKLLNEVVIKSEKYKNKKDTIRYNLNHFLIGNEVVIEDALKKLPGITVESNGTIKYGNQEIEKVMVDGEDFLKKDIKH